MDLPRITRWLLPASLALNVFLGTVILTSRFHPPPPRDPGHMIEEMASVLPPEDAAVLRASFARYTDAMAQARQRMHGFPDRIRAALEAPVFDAGVLKAALASGREARDTMDDAMAAALIEAAGTMSPQGRRKLASWRPHHPPPRD